MNLDFFVTGGNSKRENVKSNDNLFFLFILFIIEVTEVTEVTEDLTTLTLSVCFLL